MPWSTAVATTSTGKFQEILIQGRAWSKKYYRVQIAPITSFESPKSTVNRLKTDEINIALKSFDLGHDSK